MSEERKPLTPLHLGSGYTKTWHPELQRERAVAFCKRSRSPGRVQDNIDKLTGEGTHCLYLGRNYQIIYTEPIIAGEEEMHIHSLSGTFVGTTDGGLGIFLNAEVLYSLDGKTASQEIATHDHFPFALYSNSHVELIPQDTQ